MPAVGAAIAATTIGKLVASVAISLAMSFLQQALFAPKAPRRELRDRREMIRSPDEARRIVVGQCEVSGPIVYQETNSVVKKNDWTWLVVPLSHLECEAVVTQYYDDIEVEFGTTDAYAPDPGHYFFNRAENHHKLGTDTQLANERIREASGGDWTADHRLLRTCYALARLWYDTDKYPNGIPQIRWLVKGCKAFVDPRTATAGWTANPAVIIRGYLMLAPENGGLGFKASEIDDASFIAAANICDEDVETQAGFLPRYTCNGDIRTDKKPSRIIEELLTACAGHLIYAGGKWKLHAGAATAATVTLTESDLRGPLRVEPRISRRDLANTIRGTYADAGRRYQTVDYPAVTAAAYLAEDDDEEILDTYDLPYTDNAAEAQRLAWIRLRRLRQQTTVIFPAKISALQIEVWDTVNLTIDELGWTAKKFRVMQWTLSEDGGVDLVLREETDSVWAHDVDDEIVPEAAGAVVTTDPAALDEPDLTVDDQVIDIAGDGSVQVKMVIAWDTSEASVFVTGYELEYKKSSATGWTSFALAGDASYHEVFGVKDGEVYLIRLRSVNAQGGHSAWATDTYTVVGKSAPPSAVTTFVVDRLADGTRRFVWTHDDAEADVRAGGGYRIRYQAGDSITWASATDLHTGVLKASPFETNELAAGEWTFGIVAVDSSGNESETPRTITATLGDPRLREVLLQRQEHSLGWPGAKTDCFVAGDGSLDAAGVNSWSDIMTGNSWAVAFPGTWRAAAGAADPIVYETPVIDVGIDATFTPLVTATGDGTPTIEMRTHTAAEGADVSGESYVATAQVQGERYIQIRVTMAGTAPRLTALTTLLDGETFVEDYENVDTSSETAPWFESIATGHFKIASKRPLSAITMASHRAIQNVGPGYSVVLISKSASVSGTVAAEFKVYDETGTLADATLDIELKGPK